MTNVTWYVFLMFFGFIMFVCGKKIKKIKLFLRQLFCHHKPYPFKVKNGDGTQVCKKCGKNYHD